MHFIYIAHPLQTTFQMLSSHMGLATVVLDIRVLEPNKVLMMNCPFIKWEQALQYFETSYGCFSWILAFPSHSQAAGFPPLLLQKQQQCCYL